MTTPTSLEYGLRYKKLEELLAYAKSNGRICPSVLVWEELWEMLPDKKQISDTQWQPELPVIMAAWRENPNAYRAKRLEEHIRYAAAHGILDEADAFLQNLQPESWFCEKAGGEE